MTKIDSHQHYWRYNEKEFGWIGEEMQTIRRDFLPEDLKKELDHAGFDGSVAVQARQNLDETAWLLDLASKYSFIKGVVGWVDLCSSDLPRQLEQFGSHSKLKGVRHVIHDEPDIDFMLRPAFLKGIGQLRSYKLTYDILIFPKHLANTLEFVKQFPDQVFVLDHIAKPDIKNGIIQPWKAQIVELARFPNVYCKLSGMVTEASWKTWKQADFKPYLETVFESFGTDRVMIGSDWPVCQVAGSYKEVMGIVGDFIQTLSDSEKQRVLGQNAQKAYHLD
jgi:L-fuconolactonase